MKRFLCLLLVAPSLFATTKYMTPSGAGAMDGSSWANAWTLAQAYNRTTGAQKYDTVKAGSGRYTSPMGRPNDSTYWLADSIYGPHIAQQLTAITLDTTYGVVIDGFCIDTVYTKFMKLTGTEKFTLRRMRFKNQPNDAGVYFDKAKYGIVQDCFLDAQGARSTYFHDGTQDGFKVAGGSESIIFERDTAIGCMHQGLAIAYGTAGGSYVNRKIVIKDCLFYDNHTGFSVQNNEDLILVDGVKSYWPHQRDTTHWGNSFQISSDSVIVRFSLFYDDTVGNFNAHNHPGCPYNGWLTKGDRIANIYGEYPAESFGVTALHFAHNTLVGYANADTAGYIPFRIAQDSTSEPWGYNRVKNNIFLTRGVDTYGNGALSAVYDQAISDTTQDEVLFAGNILWKGWANSDTATHIYRTEEGHQDYDLATTKTKLPSWWLSSNREVDPLLTDPTATGPNKDLTLQSSSTARDAAVSLTTATYTVSDKDTCTVGDALWFYDGWNIPGQSGDSVQIGSANPVRIASIDYPNRRLTLSSTRSWGAGDGIYYYRNGQKVNDIGALQYPDPPPAPTERKYQRIIRR